MSAKRESPDILYLIEARLDSGRSKGAPQLNKDIRVLQKAATEIEQLRGDLMAEIHTSDELRAQLAEAKRVQQDLLGERCRARVDAERDIMEKLKEPGVVRANILRGVIVLPHGYGETDVLEQQLAEAKQQLAEARAELEQQPRAVPAGCAIVPVEPTGSMLEAGCKQHTCVQHDPWYSDNEISEHDAGKIYRAMLQAAPPPPAQAHCGYTKVESCNDVGCFHLEAGEDHQPPAQAEPVELMGIAEVLEEGDGFWRSCTGCHESGRVHAQERPARALPDTEQQRRDAESEIEAAIPEGWVLFSADFSRQAMGSDPMGSVMLVRDEAGRKWWHSLDDMDRDQQALYATGWGRTLIDAVKAAAQAASAAEGQSITMKHLSDKAKREALDAIHDSMAVRIADQGASAVEGEQ